MFKFKLKFVPLLSQLEKAEKKGVFRSLDHAAASLRKDVVSTIQKAPKEGRVRAKKVKGKVVRHARHAASPPGTPPFTGRGQLKRAILFNVSKDKKSAVIGPSHDIMGKAGAAHEFGGAYKGADYPERSYMGPGLKRIVPRFAGEFAGSIGG